MVKKDEIRVVGCVRKAGPVALLPGAPVQDAIDAAGGFGGQGMQPTGVITIRSRRKSDCLYYKRRALDYLRNPQHLKVEVQLGDLLIVQHDVDTWKPS